MGPRIELSKVYISRSLDRVLIISPRPQKLVQFLGLSSYSLSNLRGPFGPQDHVFLIIIFRPQMFD